MLISWRNLGSHHLSIFLRTAVIVLLSWHEYRNYFLVEIDDYDKEKHWSKMGKFWENIVINSGFELTF